MAESDTILQLGIDAAREGNRDEARNLFSLLTRQEPDNVQAWLWLAGVAEGPEERRGALERVVELDPNNEMAIKGLQAMGAGPASTSAPVAPIAPTPVSTPVSQDLSDEERYAAELDSAFGDDYESVERVGGTVRNEPTIYDDSGTAADAGAYGPSARERVASRRNARRSLDDDDVQPARGGSGLRNILLGLLALLIVLILLFLVLPGLLNRGGGSGVATGPTSTATTGSGGGIGGTSEAGFGTATPEGGLTGPISGTDGLTNTGEITNTGEVTGTDGTTTEPAPQPTPAAPAGDPAAANPAVVEINTPLEANGWTFTFPNAAYAASLGTNVGSFATQGRYVVVVTFVGNNTGTAQTIPADFFVLKDAQGRVYESQPQVSSAYVIRGVNADLGAEDAIPANGLLTSVPLIFDVAPDATNLVMFSRYNQAQGFQVLNAVP